MKFAKGHGTQNDFVVLPDLPAQLELTAAAVARSATGVADWARTGCCASPRPARRWVPAC